MTSTNTDDTIKLPNWFVRLCKWFWSKQKLFWGTVIAGLVLNVIASLLFADPSTLNNLPIHYLFRFWWFFALIGIALWIFTFFVALISRLGAPSSKNDVRRSYLRRMANDNQILELKGIPAGLIADSVRMDEVFISLQLRPNRPKTDYPLTDRELERLQKTIANGNFPKDQDKVVLDAEKNWQYILKRTDRISIAEMWNQLSDEEPAAVIQGYPGIGKSTLMERLTLYMARRGLQQPDRDMPEGERLGSPLIPILIRLGKYAKERASNANLSIAEYITQVCDELHLPLKLLPPL